MVSIKVMIASLVLLAAGEATPLSSWLADLKPFTELTALGGLIAALFYLFRYEMPALRKEREGMRKEFSGALDHITDKWDRWEQIRHDDHKEAVAVQRMQVENCTSTRLAMLANGGHANAAEAQ